MGTLERLTSLRPGVFASALLVSLGALLLPSHIQAQEEEDPSPYSDATLISEVTGIQPGTPFTVAVHFTMDPGWHNYWQNAGDSGLPTTIEWKLPEGFRAGEIRWPIPDRYEVFPLVDYVYSGEVALLVEVTPPADLSPGERVTLEALVDWLICEEICLPAHGEVALELPVTAAGPKPDPRWTELFRDTRNRLPKVLDTWIFQAEATESGYRLKVTAADDTRSPPDSVYFFPSEGSVLDHAAPQRTVVSGGELTLALEASPYATAPTPVLRGVLLAEEGGSWDAEGRVTGLQVEAPVAGVPDPPAPPAGADLQGSGGPGTGGEGDPAMGAVGSRTDSQGVTLLLALVFAFFGGMLLNLMPCVFPVLSLKILGAASQGGGNRTRIRNQGVVFGLGVLLSFLALGGLLLLLRAGGAQLGWGFQLQSPLFVAFMAALFFAIGLNLMGVFEVGVALTRVGGQVGEPSGYGDSLASGVLATVIATPCTAPFMGAALGFALTRSVGETFLIFGVLGVGMALPYVVLSMAPGLLERLPRPGPWMETLKEVLAFPMFATVIWLVWVFGQQTGMGGAAYLLSALLLIGAAGWMVGRWHRTDLRSGILARGASALLVAGAVFAAVRGSAQDAPLLAVEEGWLPFAQAEVERTVAQGRPAFVDFTAAWCLTCQVNERVVLSTDRIQEAFRSRNVALYKADWTRQDPEITAALEALDRNGVPVYALYRGRPGEPPHLLPAILTEQIVLDALDIVLSP